MRYIGSKKRIINFIDTTITNTYGNYNGAVIADLFAGTCSVAEHFKRNGARVITNDYMNYSYAFQISKIKINDTPRCNISYQEAIDRLNNIVGQDGFFYREYTNAGPGGRNYFLENNARKIDAICIQLRDWLDNHIIDDDLYYLLKANLIDAVTKVSNTSGTYGAFLKVDDNRKFKPLTIEPSEIIPSNYNNECFCMNIEDLIDNVRGDILYLDPPYNNRQYPPYYHILETVTLYDNPEIYGVTGRRHYDDKLSRFCMKDRAIDATCDIINRANFGDIYISYSTEGMMPYEELCGRLSQFGNVNCYFQDYRRYKSNSSGSDSNDSLREIIIHVEK